MIHLLKNFIENNDEECRYIFFADKVEVEDITDKTYFFSLVGPKSNEVCLRSRRFVY